MPGDRPILLLRYVPFFTDGRPEIELVRTTFRRDALVELQRNVNIAEKRIVQTLFSNEEDDMSNATDIITIAATGDVKATEEALQSSIGQAVKRALWLANKKDEFMAIPVLEELSAKYGGGGEVKAATLDEKEGKVLKLAKADSVDDRVWQAILKKANKIGAVTKSAAKNAEMIVRKKEADTFIKAVSGVKGITIA